MLPQFVVGRLKKAEIHSLTVLASLVPFGGSEKEIYSTPPYQLWVAARNSNCSWDVGCITSISTFTSIRPFPLCVFLSLWLRHPPLYNI